MTAEHQDKPVRARTQPLSFLPVNVAKVMLSDGVAEVYQSNELMGAMFKLAMLTWNDGPMPIARAKARIGGAALAQLLELGVATDTDDLVSIQWVEEARTDADSLRVQKAEKARKAAQTRWESDASACKRMQPHASASHNATEREEREERNTSSPSEKKPRTRGSAATKLWSALWLENRGVEWGWQSKDGVCMSRVVALAGGNLDEVERRIRAMFAAKDLWTQQNASPGLLLSQWNKWAVQIVPLTATQRLAVPTQESQDLLASLQQSMKEQR